MSFIDKNHLEKLNIHPKLQNDNLNEQEVLEKIRYAHKEHLYFFKNGQQLARFEGESNYVNPTEEQLIRMKDCTVLHNHPNSQSFSVEDMIAITKYDAKNFIVTSPYYIYKVIRPQTGWVGIKNNPLFEESASQAEDLIHKIVQRGEINYSDKALLENHYTWSLFFKLTHIHYEKNEVSFYQW